MKYFVPALITLLIVLIILFIMQGRQNTVVGGSGGVKCPMAGMKKDIEGIQIS